MLTNQQLTEISNQLLIDIDNYCDRKWGNENRPHLGFSSIGDECQRKLWYGFRWVKTPAPTPRFKRLFDRGHQEERRFIDYLQGIGCVVEPFDMSYRLMWDKDEDLYIVKNINNSEYDEADSMGFLDVSSEASHLERCGLNYPVQWRVSSCHGHAGGSLDGKGYLPKQYGIDEQILFEFKTHNNKSFIDLQKQGMRLSKPVHYAQCCAYGYKEKLNYVCYIAVNKDTDALHLEVVALNHKTGEALVDKADKIVLSQEPPPRLHENPTFWLCKSCNYFGVCHAKQDIDRNCRSCKHAEPAKEKQWVCNKFNRLLTDEIIVREYGCWEGIV